MSGRPYQPYQGYSAPPPPGLQPGHGPPPQQYPPHPSASPNLPYGQSQYNAPPSYGQPPTGQSYNRPPPPPPGSHQGSFGQQQPYQQPPHEHPPYPPQSSPYQSTPGYGYGGQQQQQQPPPGQYPPQGGYQQPGQYGGPPPPQQQQVGPAQINAYKQILQACIQENNLHPFYPPNSQTLDRVAQRAATVIDQVCGRWRIPKEVGNDLVKLGLFDIILYIDDSGSMQFEENGERIADLKLILQRVAYAATLFDEDGINVRFMNSTPPHHLINGVRSEAQVEQLMSSIQFKGLTPMGTELRNKVIDGLVFSQQLRKPVLVITITDGQPAGEPQNSVFETIRYAVDRARSNPQYGPGTVQFQFAQVGNDTKAREFLGKLDEDPMVGSLVDCTSNYENESEEMARANPPVNLTPELWLVKLLLGAIDHSYDRQDEKTNRPPPGQYGGPPPPGQYGGGAPPPGQYGAPPGQYGAPQQSQYGQQQPPYGGQQPPYGGQPQYGQPQPLPQGGYPGQYGGQPGQPPYPGQPGGGYPGQYGGGQPPRR